MALSNIRREPQREITEQVVGIAVFALLFCTDWWLTTIVMRRDPSAEFIPAMLLIPLGLGAIIGAFTALMFALHALGEAVCNAIAEKWDVELRPRERK